MTSLAESAAAAARALENARYAVAFTGAGISVESGIPPFRGPGGLWSRYDPGFLEIGYFRRQPGDSWKLIKEIFYDFFGTARPNAAHLGLAELERRGLLQEVITQNIDNLHQEAGSGVVHEFHGTCSYLKCSRCGHRLPARKVKLEPLPPYCDACGGVLRPDFVFFGEAIPEPANSNSFAAARKADLFLVVGTTGEIMPASLIPHLAKENGALIVEINPQPSNYTDTITDIFLHEKATIAVEAILQNLGG